jgi:hypothetical protein
MRKRNYHTYLTEQERLDVIKLLIDLNTALAAKGKYTDAVDDLLVKLTIARRKKLKISYI